MKFANVIVDISHEKLDRPFGYIIPDELEKEITVGTAVIIPFGKGNRQIKGYVIEITDQPSFWHIKNERDYGSWRGSSQGWKSVN